MLQLGVHTEGASSQEPPFTESCKESDVVRSGGWDSCSRLEGPVLGSSLRFKRKIMSMSKT